MPFLSQARGIMSYADRRIATHVLLRSPLTAPYSRVGSPNMREEETSGLRWRVAAEPVYLDVMPPKEGAAWTPVRASRRRSPGDRGASVTAETVRLGRLE